MDVDLSSQKNLLFFRPKIDDKESVCRLSHYENV